MKAMFKKSDKMCNIDQLKNFVRSFTEDLTFKDVYEKNGWILNVTVTT